MSDLPSDYEEKITSTPLLSPRRLHHSLVLSDFSTSAATSKHAFTSTLPPQVRSFMLRSLRKIGLRNPSLASFQPAMHTGAGSVTEKRGPHKSSVRIGDLAYDNLTSTCCATMTRVRSSMRVCCTSRFITPKHQMYRNGDDTDRSIPSVRQIAVNIGIHDERFTDSALLECCFLTEPDRMAVPENGTNVINLACQPVSIGVQRTARSLRNGSKRP